MVFGNNGPSRQKIETVLDCVERKGPFSGFQEARSAIPKCASSEFPNMSNGEMDELVRAAERWMEDSFTEPQAVMQTPDGRRDITRFTAPMGFKVQWVSSDAWRGHYDVDPPKGWTRVSSETILSMHPTEQDLANAWDAIRPAWNSAGIDWVAVFPRTSNVFATGFDLYVKKSQKQKALKVGKQATKQAGQGGFF